MEIEEGFLLSLKCRVEGDSNPKIHWFKDGVPINSIHNPNADITVAFQKSQLRIKNMQLSDSGNYSCLGASETNRMSRWVYVTDVHQLTPVPTAPSYLCILRLPLADLPQRLQPWKKILS
ncbi:uncharacterized protein DEA37_0001171 [Paragonimus westermani]|uniref:Ig-like domain-containing protein n=1 Tax=Paragonimus westermani TaxID=34504 RepID=A0A5J4NE26_9TREM|nr:uncharacterized protein DEA37_0001171 [Paragonimus westermani]